MNMDFANRLKQLRKERNSTQKEMSYFLKIDRSNIANYENGKRFPPIETLVKIADFYHVTIDYLLFGKKGIDEQDLQNEFKKLLDVESRYNEIVKERDAQIQVMREYVVKLREYNDSLERRIKGDLQEN